MTQRCTRNQRPFLSKNKKPFFFRLKKIHFFVIIFIQGYCRGSVFGKVLNGNKHPLKCVIISPYYKASLFTAQGNAEKEVCYEKGEIRLYLSNLVILSKARFGAVEKRSLERKPTRIDKI